MLHQTYGSVSATAHHSDALTALEITNVIIWPLKGFFTYLAYMRPPWKRANTRSSPVISGIIKFLSPLPTSGSSSNDADSAEPYCKRSRIPKLSFKSLLRWANMAGEHETSSGIEASLPPTPNDSAEVSYDIPATSIDEPIPAPES